ncbi:apolipoprotein B-100 isoform X2 [Phyllostomus discolor]|uniref:Apolipoprotein B-100 isoform X2 n=1 Tax=Phyllostomus discolor TaxID=89673 RepID=A0A7E6DWH6_9CHIR|nr:apolipoprotein B-100 isoform X2 [Phyllostomus discolor]
MGPPGPALLLPGLLLLLLLGAGARAEDEVLENVSPICPKDATRFKHLRKYVYNYEAESSSGVPRTADSRSVTKINCKVELEVPQLCSFILRTSQCTLREVHGFTPEGRAMLKKARSSDEFSEAMSRYELRLAMPEGKRVVLYPEEEEPKHILNVKRGIISALLVPPETEEAKQVLFLDTVYGNCSSDFTVKTRKGNVATEISIERKLETCDHFEPVSTGVSPLALIKGTGHPLSTQISSSQSCQYTLDPKRKHVSEATCKEEHLFLPFFHENKHEMMTQVTQTLKLEDTPKINSRFFEEGAEEAGLAFESTKSTARPQQAEAALKTLRELQQLHASEENAQRANLFNKLVAELRGLDSAAVASLLPKLLQVSSPVTLQALIQCGQPQCYTYILQWLRSEKANPLLIDIVTYLVALTPEPSAERLQEIFNTAKEQQSRATFYALSHVINRYHETHPTETQDLLDIADYLLEQIQDDCAGNEEHTYLILRVIGNIGGTMEQLTPRLTSALLNCVRSAEPSLLIQKAAIQALRKMKNKDEVREVLLQTFLDAVAPGDKRLAAYLMLMRDPSQSDISNITQLLPGEQNQQVKNFVASHIANILNSEELYVQDLKELVKGALENSQLPTLMDFKAFSRNYHFSKSVSLPSLDPVSAKIEGNLIFDPSNYLPRESMLKTTLTVFGLASVDLFELGLEGKGFEPTVEAFFGKNGFFPDSVNKALYWVDGQVPDHVSKVLVDHFGYNKDDKHEQDMVKGIMLNLEKLFKDLKSEEFPEGRAYLRILGEELGFVRLHDLRLLGRLFLNGARTLTGIPQMIAEAVKRGASGDLFLHYIFMDNAFELPTSLGLPLQVSSSGVLTPGMKAGVKLEAGNRMQAELVAKPSVSVEFVTNMGVVIPHFARSGVQMNVNFFHETGLTARAVPGAGRLKLIIEAPKRPVKLFSISNTLHLVSTTKMQVIPSLMENRESQSICKPFITGLNYCTTSAYSDSGSYYPLIGHTSLSRYDLELRPTGEVEQYSASAIYNLQEEGKAWVDSLKFVIQAEGVKQTEASMTFRYNRQTRTLTSEMQIPDLDVDLGTVLRVSDESAEEETSYKLTLDIQNKKITEIALTGQISCDKKEEGKIKGVISIPRLQAEARSEALAHWSPTKLLLRSGSHRLRSGRSVSTALDHKVSVLLTPAEQSGSWRLRTQYNQNEYSHELDAYNTKDQVGVELTGRALADLTVLDSPIAVPFLFRNPVNVIDVLEMRDTIDQPQEFTMVASVKYDKNQDVHTINLPFLHLLPEHYEKGRVIIVTSLEAIQRELKRVNIDEFMTKYRTTLDELSQQVNDQLSGVSWEEQVSSAKEKLAALAENYGITENDLKIALDNAKINFNEKLQAYVIQFDQYIKDNYDLHDFKTAITKIIDQIIEKLKTLDEHYHIRVNLVKAIHDLYLFVETIDFNKAGISTASWIQKMDTQYQIRSQVQEKLQQLKTQIENIDIQHLAETLKQQVEAINVRVLLNLLKTAIPFQKIKHMIKYVKHYVRNFIEDYEVTEKINAFRAVVHRLIQTYEIDRHIQVLLDKSVQLAHKYKVKETVQQLSNVLQQVGIKDHFEKLVGFIDDAVTQLKALSFKKFIEEVNRFLDVLIKELRSFDYHQFVDNTNNKIHEVTQRINGEIQALELPQKAQALKLFVEDINTVVSEHLENIKATNITLFTDRLQEALNSKSLSYMKAKFRETLQDIRDRIDQMDFQQTVQQYLLLVGQVYDTVVTYISDWWSLAAKNLTDFAAQHSMQGWAETLKALVEQGFTVPEIQTAFGTVPAFEVSLRALQEATFKTPAFTVPLTDLKIPSIQINFKRLGDIQVPLRFSTPEFTVLNTFHIPSFTIDLIEIRAKIIQVIDQVLDSELQWSAPEVYLRDLKGLDTVLTRVTLPDFHVPEITIPEFLIPNLDLRDFQVPDLHIPDFQLPDIPHTIAVPTFGKLHSVWKIQSPLFTLDVNADVQNVTTSVNEAGITASITAKGDSKLEVLKFDFQGKAQLLYPEVNPVILKESMSFSSTYLKTEHKSEVLFLENAVEGKSNTVAGLHTEKNTLQLSHGVLVRINNQLTLDSNTKYFHKLNIPKLDFSSQANLHNEIQTLLEAGHIEWTSSGTGSWKWACPTFSDEGTHESQISFTVKGPLTSLEWSNQINSKHLRVNQTLDYESRFLDLYQLEIQSQVESPHVGHSVLTAKGTAQLRERKVKVTGNHDAHLHGRVHGTLKNSLFLSAQPLEMTASTNNEGNLKVSFPLKLTAKIGFLNNYALFLSPNAQQASWQASARFNQYKYNQNFSATNNENSIEAHVGVNGEANLDFLNNSLTIPETTLPYTRLTIPHVQNFSIWEKTGLGEFLKTTQQSFDLSVNARYKKNKDKHSIPIPLDALYVFINKNINSFNRHFEEARGKALNLFTRFYNNVKIRSDKYKVETALNKQPTTFQIPEYTIPAVNAEVSPFTVEMLPFGYVTPKEISLPSVTVPDSGFYVPSQKSTLDMPVLNVPRNFLEFSLPEIKVPNAPNNIFIPAMGNITYDFSFKSSVITLNTNVGLYNQSDIVAHLLTSASSVIDALQYKLEGTSSLTGKRGLKVATALSLSNKFVEGKHNSTISLTRNAAEASMTTRAKVQSPILKMDLKQKLNGNPRSNPTVSSSVELKYDFNAPELYSTASGTIGHKLSLETLTSYFSMESSHRGNIQGSVLSQEYSGMIANEVNTYVNSKGTRSSVKLQGASKVDGIWNLEVKESFAGETTLQRVYAIWEHNTKNHLQLVGPFSTSGEHAGKATLELSPWRMSALVQVSASQPSYLLDLDYLGQEMALNINTENQKVSWRSEIKALSGSLQNDVQLSNDQKEARLDIAGSLEGHLRCLNNIALPVYAKTLWELLKLDVTTSTDQKQSLHASAALAYTKNPRGYVFSIPVQELADKFVIPGLKGNTLNSVFVTPAFQVPFTDLQVPSYLVDFSEIQIYKKLSTSPFALKVPALPTVKFPEADVLTKYSSPGDSSVPFFEIAVPESELTIPQLTYPESISIGAAVLDLNEVAGKIADFRLPNITLPDQTIKIPSMKFSVPAGIYIPSFGALTARFGVTSPLYNTTWSAGLKNKEDHVETFLDSTGSSTIQFLEYNLNVVGTHEIEGGTLVSKTNGTFAHRDVSAAYKEDGKYQGFLDWKGEARLDVTSPTFTDAHLRYHSDGDVHYSAAFPAIGTVAMDSEHDNSTLKYNLYYRPQTSPDKKLSIFKIELIFPESHETLEVKVNWEEEAVSELLTSLKDNVPKATEALYDGVNRYHKECTGLDLRDASLGLRRSLQSTAEQTYHEAVSLIDEVDQTLELRRVARDATRTYQLWNDKAQNLYQELLDQEGQVDLQRLQNTVLDNLIGVTREYKIMVRRLTGSFIDYLKFAIFRLPGGARTYTVDELCTMVMKEVGRVLSQVHSKIHSGLEILFSYLQDLMEKSELIKDLEIKFPFDSKSHKLTDVTLEYGKLLKSFSQQIQKVFNDLQSNNTTQMLGDLQRYLQNVFQDIEGAMNCFKGKKLTNLIHDISTTFNSYIQYIFKFLKENLNLDLGKLNELIQNKLQEASQELEQIHQYIKALHKEYFDSKVGSWAMKYYELEDKIINLIKKLVDILKDFHSKYAVNATSFASQLSSEVEQFVQKDIQKYLSILADADGKGKEKIVELSTSAQEIIKSWTTAMKKIIFDYHQQFKYKLQNLSDQLPDYYEKFIAESKRLIDLSIQKYQMFLSYIMELLRDLKSATVGDMSHYVKIAPGEFTITF